MIVDNLELRLFQAIVYDANEQVTYCAIVKANSFESAFEKVENYYCDEFEHWYVVKMDDARSLENIVELLQSPHTEPLIQ